MSPLEERLRSALAGLADEVPPSRDPWAEQQRRLAAPPRRSRRTPVLVAAAAAAVIVASVPASVVTRHPGPVAPTQPNQSSGLTGPPPAPTTPSGYDPSPDGPYATIINEPVLLNEFTEDGLRWAAWVFVERHPEGTGWANRLCVIAAPVGEPPNGPRRHPNSDGGCRPVHAWPGGPNRSYVEIRAVLGGSTLAGDPLPGQFLFVTAPQVSTLEVRTGDGAPVPVRSLGRTDELVLFLADFGGPATECAYTARDAAGGIVEQRLIG